MKVPELLTAGMVGKQLLLEFSPEWDNLTKTVIFSNGKVTVDVLFTENPVTIPARVLETPMKNLWVGLYGMGDEGRVAIPTLEVKGPMILAGVEPSGDSATDPDLSVWSQVLLQMGDLSLLKTQSKDSLVNAINELSQEGGKGGEKGVTFYPAVSQEGILSWSNDGELPNPEPVNLRGEDGYSPVRGADYWTEADKAEIRGYVDDAILGGSW